MRLELLDKYWEWADNLSCYIHLRLSPTRPTGETVKPPTTINFNLQPAPVRITPLCWTRFR